MQIIKRLQETVMPNLVMSFVGAFCLVMLAFGTGQTELAEPLAFWFVATAGGASFYVVRAGIKDAVEPTIPLLPNYAIMLGMSVVTVGVGYFALEVEDARNLTLNLFSHLGALIQLLAKTKAGDTDE